MKNGVLQERENRYAVVVDTKWGVMRLASFVTKQEAQAYKKEVQRTRTKVHVKYV